MSKYSGPRRPDSKADESVTYDNGSFIGTQTKRSPERIADAFLGYCFEPVQVEEWPVLIHQKAVEASYWNSLSNLCSLYKLNPADFTSNRAYPQNIAHSFDKVVQSLNRTSPLLRVLILADADRAASLTTNRTYRTDPTTYFIPLSGVVSLMVKGAGKRRTALIKSIFAYLCHVLKLDFYASKSSYVSYQYEMLLENLLQQEEDDEQQPGEPNEPDSQTRQLIIEQVKQEQRETGVKGAHFLRSIDKPVHLTQFAGRYRKFRDETGAGKNGDPLTPIAAQFVSLYRDYPQRALSESYNDELTDEEGQDYEGQIEYQRMFSIIWDESTQVMDCLFESLDADFQSGIEVQNPVCVQWFDKPQTKEHHSFDFEERLERALTELIKYLYTVQDTPS